MQTKLRGGLIGLISFIGSDKALLDQTLTPALKLHFVPRVGKNALFAPMCYDLGSKAFTIKGQFKGSDGLTLGSRLVSKYFFPRLIHDKDPTADKRYL